jgi:virginiamycin A acetyltransferase
LSFTPYLYDQNYAKRVVPPIEQIACVIEDDVWIGHGAIILPSAARIGRGAAIGAGAVVTKDVPAYAIVAGNPARVIRQRFSPRVIAEVESLKWWEWDSKKLLEFALENHEFVYNINARERIVP